MKFSVKYTCSLQFCEEDQDSKPSNPDFSSGRLIALEGMEESVTASYRILAARHGLSRKRKKKLHGATIKICTAKIVMVDDLIQLVNY